MNKKGFTLVELLGVLVLIGLLIGIGVPGISKISNNIKQKSLNTKINQVEHAAILWGQNNKTTLQETECDIKEGITTCKKVSIKYLIEEDYLDSENYKELAFINPVDESSMLNKCVYIYKKNNRVYAKYIKNEVCEIDEGDNNNEELFKNIYLRQGEININEIDLEYINSYYVEDLNIYIEGESDIKKVRISTSDKNISLSNSETPVQSIEIEIGEKFVVKLLNRNVMPYNTQLKVELLDKDNAYKTYSVNINTNPKNFIELVKFNNAYDSAPLTKELSKKPGEYCAIKEEPTFLKDEDDYGTTYYFRGNPTNNYVIFNNMCWRIVRIQDRDKDGIENNATVKLILNNIPNEGETVKCSEDTTSAYIEESSYGYKYEEYESSIYLTPDFNHSDFSTGLVGPGYYLSWFMVDYFGYGEKKALLEELVFDDTFNVNPICHYKADDDDGGDGLCSESIFKLPASFKIQSKEAEKNTSNIQLLTADELAFAGGILPPVAPNTTCNFYLKGSKPMLTLDLGLAHHYEVEGLPPYYIENPIFLSTDGIISSSKLSVLHGPIVEMPYGVRPVIVLNNNTMVDGFDTGTIEDPYIIWNKIK